jgi:signal peptidase I
MFRWLSRLVVGVIAAAATFVVVAAAVPVVTPLRMQIVLSGSMAPALPVGALVMTAPLAGQAVPGDIVTFANPVRPGTSVVHRVIAVEVGADDSNYVTKGDANDSPDGWRVSVGAATGRVVAVIPFVGYAVGTLQRPLSRFGIALVILGSAFVSLRPLRRRPRVPGRPRPQPRLRAPAHNDLWAEHLSWLTSERVRRESIA